MSSNLSVQSGEVSNLAEKRLKKQKRGQSVKTVFNNKALLKNQSRLATTKQLEEVISFLEPYLHARQAEDKEVARMEAEQKAEALEYLRVAEERGISKELLQRMLNS